MSDENWYTQDQSPQPQGKTSRRWWLWGCLLPLPILLCGGLIGGIVFFVFGLLKSSDPYVHSLQAAQANAELIAAIGQPIEASWLISGQIQLNNDAGHANLSYTVSGPLGSAEVTVVGTKNAGAWSYSQMQALVAGTGKVIALRPEP